MKKVILLALTFCFAATAIVAQSATNLPYDSMLNELKAGKTDIDFKALRHAYTKTSDYNPRGIDPRERGKIADLIRNKKFQDAVTAAENILKTNYVDMSAHMYASMAYAELKNDEKAGYHENVYVGLINSIVDGVKGSDAKDSFEIISMAEEFSVLLALEYRRRGQTISEENGKRYGIVTAIDPQTNGEVKLYFNIDSFASKLPQPPAGRGGGGRPQRP